MASPVEHKLEDVEARLKDLRGHIPPNLEFAIQDLIAVARHQQNEIAQLKRRVPEDDGR